MPDLLLFGEITSGQAAYVVRMADAIRMNDPRNLDRLRIVLNSAGGSVTDALAICDTVGPYKPDILVTGFCGSAANIILQFAGLRLATANAIFNFHGVFAEEWGLGKLSNKKIEAIVVARAGQENFDWAMRTRYFGAPEALEHKLIDQIAENVLYRTR